MPIIYPFLTQSSVNEVNKLPYLHPLEKYLDGMLPFPGSHHDIPVVIDRPINNFFRSAFTGLRLALIPNLIDPHRLPRSIQLDSPAVGKSNFFYMVSLFESDIFPFPLSRTLIGRKCTKFSTDYLQVGRNCRYICVFCRSGDKDLQNEKQLAIQPLQFRVIRLRTANFLD